MPIKIHDYIINLINNYQPLYRLIYSLKVVKLETLKTYIKTHIINGFIKSFKSSVKTSIFL